MNSRTWWAAFMLPMLLIFTLIIAIPAVLDEEACGIGTTMGTPADGLTVATWNTWGDAGDRLGNPLIKRAPYIAQRITMIHPDLFMLQESSARKNGPAFQEYLVDKTGLQAAGPGNQHRKLLYNASRLVLLDAGLWRLPGPDSRTGVYGKFRDLRTQKQFVAVTTHLEYRTSSHYEAVRLRQMRALESKMTAYAGGLPVVLGGDLNTSLKRDGVSGSGALTHLKSQGWVNANTAATKINAQMGTALGAKGVKTRKVTSPGPKTPIDYIFASPGATAHWWALQPQAPIEGDHYLRINSDHNIITAGITLAGFGDPAVGTGTPTTPPPGSPTAPRPAIAAAPVKAPAPTVPASVGRWGPNQVKNAAIIAATGKKLGISARGQVIAIMTAMGESSLEVKDHGDVAGPDSRGLFQQRDGWGTLADRMNPGTSAERFYRAMVKVAGWQELEPTEVAHRTQRNADPNHYAKFWDEATAVYAATEGITLTANDISSFAPECVGDDTMNAAYAYSGTKCDFGKAYPNPNTCGEALAEAARIANASACKSDLSGGTWRRWCLAFVARAYGHRFAGYPTAMAMYQDMKARGLIQTGKTIPPGALVFFRTSSPAGHVALYAGDGKAFSNDYIRSGCIDLTPMDRMGGGGKYLGWSPPAFNA